MAERFRFTGDVPWDQAARFISAFDVAVAPARFANARSGISPQKVYAYLACERPVVGSDLDGLGDVLVNEGVGLSFPAGEAAVLARAIIQLLTDPPRAKEMGQRGRRLVLVRYTWEQVVTRTLRMFADIAKGHAGGQPPVPPEVYRREYYLRDREGSAEFVESRGHRLCAQHAEALKLADIREGHHVLDVGCGCGELAIHAALRGAKTIGIDYAPAAVELAKEALGTFPPDVQARVRLILASAEEPVLEKVDPESIDRIFLMDVLEHLYPWQIERLYARLFRILKPGGRMICHTWPNRWHTTCVYPLVARVSRLFGIEKSEHVRAAHDEVMHVNEQTPWGVWRDATRAGFRVKIWMAHESSAASNRCVRWLYDAVHRTPPCGFAFGDDIWCVATRKS
ncbi:MAG: methyltransferase domain-containing protein [Candidatus Omnitrophica bacterium]|nr:methyltransferase domain-containing protein [Candidatus Omnitrophota bacterium]